jgi:glycosyltransferase involved in cell wall biosynthesis
MNKDTVCPNFFVVGVPKAGTSSIGYYLNRHPDIYVSPLKEPFYFSTDICEKDFTADYRRRATLNLKRYLKHNPLPKRHIAHITDLSDYLELFREVTNEKAVGELSTGYMYSSMAAENIFKFNPDAKIVMVLRQPVERAYSHYCMHVRDFMQFNYDFLSALNVDVNTIEKGWGRSHLYVELGLYFKQVQRFLEIFPENQVKIILYDDLLQSPVKFMEELYTFLGVNPTKSNSIDYAERKNIALTPSVRVPKILEIPVSYLRGGVNRYLPHFVKSHIRSTLFSKSKVPKLQRNEFDYAIKYFETDIKKLSVLIKRDLQSWFQWPSKPAVKRSLTILIVTNMYPSTGDASWRGVFIKEQVKAFEEMFPEIHFDILHIKGGISNNGRKFNYISGYFRYLLMMRKTKYDIVWAHHSLCVFLAAAHKKIPLVYTVHEGKHLKVIEGGLVASAIKYADHVIYVNKNAFENSSITNSYFIPSGVDTGKFRCLARDKCRATLGLVSGKYYVFFPASANRPEKNASFAYSFIDKESTWLDSENIEFIFGGSIENELMPIWMNAVDCMVSFSDFESDGMVFKEAMACDLPVITFDIGNASLYFKHEYAGSLIGRDHNELKEKIVKWKKTGRSKGRDYLLTLGMDKYSVAQQLKNTFEEIANGKN